MWFKRCLTLIIGLFLFALILGILSQSAQGKEWTVDDDGSADFSSIQDAVDGCLPGDTILVKAGDYQEYPWVDKTLTLSGEGAHNTSIQASGNPLSITAPGVTVKGFSIWGRLDILDDDIRVTDNILIYEGVDGVVLRGQRITFSHNILQSSLQGTINLRDCENCSLENNSFKLETSIARFRLKNSPLWQVGKWN